MSQSIAPSDMNKPKTSPVDEQEISIATPRQLMWWKFRKHKVAVFSTGVLIFMYLLALFAGFVSPYDPNAYNASYKYVPPMVFGLVDGDGNFTFRPGVYNIIQERDPETLRTSYQTDYETWYPIHFFVQGAPYKLLGLIETDLHLFGLGEDGRRNARIFYSVLIALDVICSRALSRGRRFHSLLVWSVFS